MTFEDALTQAHEFAARADEAYRGWLTAPATFRDTWAANLSVFSTMAQLNYAIAAALKNDAIPEY